MKLLIQNVVCLFVCECIQIVLIICLHASLTACIHSRKYCVIHRYQLHSMHNISQENDTTHTCQGSGDMLNFV